MLAVQAGRSILYLLPLLLVMNAWAGSRRQLGWSLGVALFLLVGLSGLIMPGLLPGWLRLVHSIEILADSLVYARAVVWLLVPEPASAPAASPAGTAAASSGFWMSDTAGPRQSR